MLKKMKIFILAFLLISVFARVHWDSVNDNMKGVKKFVDATLELTTEEATDSFTPNAKIDFYLFFMNPNGSPVFDANGKQAISRTQVNGTTQISALITTVFSQNRKVCQLTSQELFAVRLKTGMRAAPQFVSTKDNIGIEWTGVTALFGVNSSNIQYGDHSYKLKTVGSVQKISSLKTRQRLIVIPDAVHQQAVANPSMACEIFRSYWLSIHPNHGYNNEQMILN